LRFFFQYVKELYLNT